MGKKLLVLFCLFFINSIASAANLVEVYNQAHLSDPQFGQTVYQQLANKANLPISIASLLPNINVNFNPSVTRTGFAGTNIQSTVGGSSNILSPRNNTARAYTMTLLATQTVFNFAQFSNVAGAYAVSKQADAAINAAIQDLMVRTAKSYFAVLQDEDNVRFSEATKIAFAEQLDQIQQQFNVGLKTQTDVYTARASYDSAVARYIAAQNQLKNDRENLRVLTGVYYTDLAKLSEKFPLVIPQPVEIETWVDIAAHQNWSIKAARYNVEYMRQIIRTNIAGNLPTVSVQGLMDRQYIENINRYNSFTTRDGPGTQTDRQIALNINVPLFAGGGVIAKTNQAIYNYQAAQQQLSQSTRNTFNLTRQSYNNILSGISQIKADRETVKSTMSSLEGMEASYQVGTETLFDVLNQQQRVYEAQTQYARARYNFVINILSLKQAAGTLSYDDLIAINEWLVEKPCPTIKKIRTRKNRQNPTKKALISKDLPSRKA